MIQNQWYAVLDAKQVKKGCLLGVTRMGEKMVFWRQADSTVACIGDICCHRGAAISCGKLSGEHPQCPFHAFEYDNSGKVVKIPANGKNMPVPERYRVKSYPVREKGGFIYLWWGDAAGKLPEVPYFDELDFGFSYMTIKDNWPVHYSRSVENQLDVVHLPFVHHNTIGRGGATLVNGPHVVFSGDRMTIYVKNAVDDGKTIPQKPEDMTEPHKLFHLDFQFPNTWQNYITPKMRVIAAFVPVDEENSVVYVRSCQSFMKFPVLKQLVDLASKFFSFIVLRQDKRVVITELPTKTTLAMVEKLVQGDLPIIEYRKRRQELMNKVEKR